MMLNEEEFAVAIVGLAEAFGGKIGEAALSIYYAALSDLDAEAWNRALTRAARECKFMPRPAELREFAGESKANERVIAAWTEAQRAVRQQGMYRSVNFEDPAINAAIRSMGGWERFCQMNSEEAEKFGRKDFDRAYVSFAKRDDVGEFGAPLAGIAERENGGRGIAPPAPVMIPSTTPVLIGARTKRAAAARQLPASVSKLAAEVGKKVD